MAHTHWFSYTTTDPVPGSSAELQKKQKRIREELIQAGATRYALRKFNSRFLPNLLGNDEHIRGVIYGRYSEGPGWLSYVDRMVVATDKRIISFNHKPGYTDADEFTYDMMDSIDGSAAGPFAAVTLNTKFRHFTIRFVKKRCAAQFIRYVKERRRKFYEGNAYEAEAEPPVEGGPYIL